jgi:pSer/pThr/pTyr-binding forkhead associated (FHA) protein
MQVKLRILKGPSEGKEPRIPTPRCIIGRGEGCHIKAHSDAVSRQHCEIITTEREVLVRDLKSRNGTLVNDEHIKGDMPVLSGDIIRVGPLEFEIIVEATPKNENPLLKPDSLDAGSKMGALPSHNSTAELQINKKSGVPEPAKRSPETQNIKLEETDQGNTLAPKKTPVAAGGSKPAEPAAKKEEPKAAPKPGAPAPPTTKNSRDAANEFLKRMFKK